MAIYIFI